MKTPDPSHKPKTSAVSVLWMGLEDELRKIAVASSTKAMGTAQMQKTKTPMPKLVSKPLAKDPEASASTADQISSTRTIAPPPVTAAGAY